MTVIQELEKQEAYRKERLKILRGMLDKLKQKGYNNIQISKAIWKTHSQINRIYRVDLEIWTIERYIKLLK